MATPSSQSILAGGALVILGGIGAAMLFSPIPAPNAQSVTFILGALAGALTVSGSGKAADRAASSTLPTPAAENGALKDPQV